LGLAVVHKRVRVLSSV